MNPFFVTNEQLTAAAKVFAKRFPAQAAKAVDVAEHACVNEFRLPYTMVMDRWVDMGNPIDWLHNPTNDLEFTWIFNRHWHMEDLGKAYLLTGNESYARAFVRHFEEWMTQNSPPAPAPYEEAVYFQRPGPWRLLETGLRVQSWIWAYRMMEASPLVGDSFRQRFFDALAEHAEYLVRYLGSTEINHAIMHMQGLFMIGVFLDNHPRSPLWRQVASERLELCLLHQVGDEGVQSELTTHYHNGSIGMFGTPFLLGRLTGYPMSEWYRSKLGRMGAFTAAVIRPDGQSTPLGDSDWVSHGRRPLGLLGAILEEESLLRLGEPSEELLWLFGAAEYRRLCEAMESFSPSRTTVAFPRTGYYFMRSESASLSFDAAGMGGAHGHADALSLEWMWRDQLIFADPGRYTYEEGKWRRHFKSTRAHNTVTVDGLDQTPYAATQQWGEPVAQCRTDRWISGPRFDFIDASHDGYERLASPVRHRRWTLLGKEPDLLVVVDWLDVVGENERGGAAGEGNSKSIGERDGIANDAANDIADDDAARDAKRQHTFEQRYQLHPEAIAERLESAADTPSFRLRHPSSGVSADVFWRTCGREATGFGVGLEDSWISRIYGSKEPAPVLSAHGTMTSSVGIVAVCLPFSSENGDCPIRIETLELNGERRILALTCTTPERTLRIRIDGASVSWDAD